MRGDFMMTDCAQNADIPQALERSEVPQYFRQFRDASVLKKLAHRGTGPLYQLIGRKAWYETADIIAWLDGRKKPGPRRPRLDPSKSINPTALSVQPVRKRRGRPSKAAQRRRALIQDASRSC